MEKNVYKQKVSERLRNAVEAKKFKQGKIIAMCLDEGLKINQSTLSKLLTSGEGLDIYRVSILCKVLDLNPAEVLSLDPDLDFVSVEDRDKKKAFVTDYSDDAFKGYRGDYKGYFYATENNDDTIHVGDFKFYPEDKTDRCLVSFSFKTGKYNTDNLPVTKRFSGTARLSTKFGAICCEMTAEDDTGDVSFIIFKYDSLANQQCICRLGMVVTICAGLKRLPVAHKLLICRQELSHEDQRFIEGQLKLNDDILLISESDYIDFTQNELLPDSFRPYITRQNTKDNDRFMAKASKQLYYSFVEDDITQIKSLSQSDKAKVINLLRKFSESRRCKKVGPKGEEFIFDYLEGREPKI